jgi:acyl-CoA reductase-like NAD-dependent aldehyde dehydrogenase
VLELGGNDACIVLPSADAGSTAASILRLATINSGQFCAAIKRVYVARRQAGELCEALAAAAAGLRMGSGHEPGTDLGPLVSQAQRERVRALVDAAKQAGGRIGAGGVLPDGPGYFYPPTVVTDLPDGTDLEQEEQFGPVVPVIAYDDLETAVRRANTTRFGLGASVWGDPNAARAVAARLDCGTVWINTHGELRHDVPFGGRRCSGMGVEYGYWGLLEYTNIKVFNERRPG